MLFAHSFNRFPYLLALDGGGGNGNDDPSAGDDPPAGGNPTAPGGRLDPERLKAKHGDAEAALRALAFKLDEVEADNASYRQQLKDLKGQVPGEGAVVLDGDQAAAWSAYQELGKPDELKQLQGEYTQLQRDQLFQQAAAAHGYKAAVLGQLPGVGELSIEVREVEQDGKKNQVAFVKNGDGAERPLPDYVKETWGDFLPALTAEQKGSQASGTPWPKQDVSSQGADTSVTNSYLERQRQEREGRKNPVTGE